MLLYLIPNKEGEMFGEVYNIKNRALILYSEDLKMLVGVP